MNYDVSRRSSAISIGAADSIPNAPPLPAPRPLQRARDAATRFFGYPSRSASPQSSPEEDRYFRGSRARYASLSATQNATVSHRTGLEINTIAINEKGTHALIGGKDIFRTVRVENGTCTQDVDLRSAIRSTPIQASGRDRQNYSIDIADVAWAKGDCGDYVAAATSLGKIILYDLGHAGLQAAQLHEHFRQVHKVTFNPHRGNLLLSGSQDGTVRLWDVRDVRQASTLQSKRKYSGQSDGVRDVKWSPTEGVDFAFGTDSGWIQRWDMRNLKTAKVKIPAHSETCNAIDWHPDGKHIATASSDKMIRVWDFSTGRRQQRASWEIKTPYRVLNARWRPACESSSLQMDSGTSQCTQLVTQYDSEHPVLHIWDLRRQALPFRELTPYATAPTDLLWHSQDLLWTVSREGTFIQYDIQHAAKTINRRNLQASAISSNGNFGIVSQKRQQSVLTKRPALSTLASKSSSRSESPERVAPLSRSWADDGLDQSFLTVAQKKRHPQSFSSTRVPSIASASAFNETSSLFSVRNLDDVLHTQQSMRPHQVALHGRLPHSMDPEVFEFLAKECEVDSNLLLKDRNDFLDSFRKLLDRNAGIADTAGLYQLAQTWRIIEFWTLNHLKERKDTKRGQDSVLGLTVRSPAAIGSLAEIARKLTQEQNKSPISSPVSIRPALTGSRLLAPSEVTSDQPTPLAKPSKTGMLPILPDSTTLPDPDNEDDLALPPSASPALTQGEMILPQQGSQLTSGNLDGLQRLQEGGTDGVDKAAMVRRWSIQPKEPLNLDPVDSNGIKIQMPKLQKQCSNESFTFLDGSADSNKPSFPSSFASNRSTPLELVSEHPSRTDALKKSFAGVEAHDFDTRPAISPDLSDEELHSPPVFENDARTETNFRRHSSPPLDHTANFFNEAEKRQDVLPAPSKAKNLSDADRERHALYLPEDGDIDLEATKPFTMVYMLRELVNYYASKGNALTAAHLLLLFTPLLPRTQPLSMFETVPTVSAYIDSLTNVSYLGTDLEAILDTHLAPVVNSGMQPLQIETILSTYHQQLVSQRFHNEAAVLRQLAYPAYPSVYEDYLKDNQIHLRCGDCGKTFTGDLEGLRCESCRVKVTECSICWLRDSPFDEDTPSSMLMTGCLLCGHIGHSKCFRAWFDDSSESDGGCPTEGCLCDCVAGAWRAEKARMAELKVRFRRHGRVKSDDLSASVSAAVERTRSALSSKSLQSMIPALVA